MGDLDWHLCLYFLARAQLPGLHVTACASMGGQQLVVGQRCRGSCCTVAPHLQVLEVR